MGKILVIIPTYNEENNIIRLVNDLFALGLGLDILVVDDGSDQTGAFLQRHGDYNTHLFLIKRAGKLGRGSAILAGLNFGLKKDYEYLAEMDADYSHEPKELSNLLANADQNTIVIASRYLKGSQIVNWPLSRRIFSKFANFYANLILGIGIHDYTNGYRVYGKDAITLLDFEKIRSTGYIVLSEIAYQLFRKGVSFRECKTKFVNRRRGESNFSLKEVKEAMLSVLRIRFRSNTR